MPFHKVSRRSFFAKSFCFAALPPAFSSLSSFAREDETKQKSSFGQVEGGHDLERLTALMQQKNPLIWVFTGDSITQGARHTHGYRSYPEIFGERIRWEMGRYRDIVINSGISGNTTQNILDDFDWRIRQFQPKVVSLMIGTNDCSKKELSPELFERNLDAILTMIRENNAIPIFHTPNVIMKEKVPERAHLAEYVTVIQHLALRKEVILVNHFAFWQEAIQKHGEVEIFKNWLNDPIHPNGQGHAEIARLMFKTIKVFDPKEPTCSGIY